MSDYDASINGIIQTLMIHQKSIENQELNINLLRQANLSLCELYDDLSERVEKVTQALTEVLKLQTDAMKQLSETEKLLMILKELIEKETKDENN